ncbi:unnamed protein product [Caenorhabditis auriculariae]|uniref:Major facilitator superfamily (MFS) profile domain-containing protein n=1 Tax=Caenorhabditis auriculariae TaxID=2777116 RepID=A0A8S1HJJ2_9PELO|nr:unnamed protein product [Caenorhabditis auriculariae]
MWFEVNRFHFFVLIAWQFAIFFATQNIFAIFSNYVPEWKCDDGPVGKDCDVFRTCKNLTFVNVAFKSAAMEFGWICSKKAYYASLFSQVQYFGVLIGTVLFGSLSDAFGRKPISTFVMTMGISLNLIAGEPSTEELVIGLRFFIGLAVGGTLVVVCTFVMELLLPQQRVVLRGFFNWGWARILLTLICMRYPTWRDASFVTATAAIPALVLIIFVLPESPTWLHNKDRLEEMRQSELYMMRFAGYPFRPVPHRPIVQSKTICEVVRTPGLFRRISVLWILWFVASVCSFATDLNSNNISGNLFFNQIMFGILVIVDSNCPSFKRRTLHQGAQAIVCVCFVVLSVMTIMEYKGVGVLITNLFGTVFMEYTWDACYLCAIESVETSCRASATGSCSLVARVGAILAPFLNYANLWWSPSVFITVVILGVINLGVSYAFLIETKNVDLDEVKMEELEEHETLNM